MKEVIKAVHSAEIEQFLSRIGAMDDFMAGRIRCGGCGQMITASNFKAVTRRAGNLIFFCSNEKCLLWPSASGENNGQLPG
jgi:hypothetical protein